MLALMFVTAATLLQPEHVIRVDPFRWTVLYDSAIVIAVMLVSLAWAGLYVVLARRQPSLAYR